MRTARWAFFGLLLFTVAAKAIPAGAGCVGKSSGDEGHCAPDFTLRTLGGEEVTLAKLRGKVVFVHFWATWCAPCLKELPMMEEIRRRLPSDRFVMLVISIDTEGKPVIERFLQEVFGKNAPGFQVLMDPTRKAAGKYGTEKVPETFLVDPTGRVRDKIQGAYTWEDPLVAHYIELLSKPCEGS